MRRLRRASNRHWVVFWVGCSDMRQSFLAKVLARIGVMLCMAALVACTPAKTVIPDLPFTQLDGSLHSLGAFKGKVVVVNFWATSCTTCVKEMPDLVETYQALAPQGLEMLAVAMEYDPPAYVSQFVKTRQLPFRVAIDHNGELARTLGPVQLTPTTFVVNKKGEVVKQYIGEPDFDAMRELLKSLLAEAP